MQRSMHENQARASIDAAPHKGRDAVLVGILFAISNIAISALQPVITRYAALRIEPLLFCASSVLVAAGFASTMLICTGEFGLKLICGHQTHNLLRFKRSVSYEQLIHFTTKPFGPYTFHAQATAKPKGIL